MSLLLQVCCLTQGISLVYCKTKLARGDPKILTQRDEYRCYCSYVSLRPLQWYLVNALCLLIQSLPFKELLTSRFSTYPFCELGLLSLHRTILTSFDFMLWLSDMLLGLRTVFEIPKMPSGVTESLWVSCIVDLISMFTLYTRLLDD